MQSKRTTEESADRGVSPVIGVILMVAITVILAAVIAAFVLDIGPGEADPGAAVSVEGDSDEVSVELQSLDGSADAVVVVDDEGDFVPYDSDEDVALTTSGQAEDFDSDDAIDSGDDIENVQAIRVSDTSDLGSDVTNIEDVDANAILENID